MSDGEFKSEDHPSYEQHFCCHWCGSSYAKNGRWATHDYYVGDPHYQVHACDYCHDEIQKVMRYQKDWLNEIKGKLPDL